MKLAALPARVLGMISARLPTSRDAAALAGTCRAVRLAVSADKDRLRTHARWLRAVAVVRRDRVRQAYKNAMYAVLEDYCYEAGGEDEEHAKSGATIMMSNFSFTAEARAADLAIVAEDKVLVIQAITLCYDMVHGYGCGILTAIDKLLVGMFNYDKSEMLASSVMCGTWLTVSYCDVVPGQREVHVDNLAFHTLAYRWLTTSTSDLAVAWLGLAARIVCLRQVAFADSDGSECCTDGSDGA